MDDKIIINIPTQELRCFRAETLMKTYRISTAANGVGEKKASFQTPRGWHIIRAKIGEGQPKGTSFIGRRPKGLYSPDQGQKDWILSRILWLSGLEIGKNRLGDCDTMQRYIYIHGTPKDNPVGEPHSKGCIRMHCDDVIDLFNNISVGTKVLIQG
jgi:lipoprotein-anchoring transpeptidase ErfK/SrfK